MAIPFTDLETTVGSPPSEGVPFNIISLLKSPSPFGQEPSIGKGHGTEKITSYSSDTWLPKPSLISAEIVTDSFPPPPVTIRLLSDGIINSNVIPSPEETCIKVSCVKSSLDTFNLTNPVWFNGLKVLWAIPNSLVWAYSGVISPKVCVPSVSSGIKLSKCIHLSWIGISDSPLILPVNSTEIKVCSSIEILSFSTIISDKISLSAIKPPSSKTKYIVSETELWFSK